LQQCGTVKVNPYKKIININILGLNLKFLINVFFWGKEKTIILFFNATA
jgi:hypothetical protein